MKENTTKPTDHEGDSMDTDNMDDGHSDVDENDPEFQELNSQIDQLNSVLDVLEKKNDDIQAQLVALLKANREIRASQNPPEENPSAS